MPGKGMESAQTKKTTKCLDYRRWTDLGLNCENESISWKSLSTAVAKQMNRWTLQLLRTHRPSQYRPANQKTEKPVIDSQMHLQLHQSYRITHLYHVTVLTSCKNCASCGNGNGKLFNNPPVSVVWKHVCNIIGTVLVRETLHNGCSEEQRKIIVWWCSKVAIFTLWSFD